MSIMKVGYARVDITPQESVPLAGYGNTSSRMSQTILDPLCATCIAFADENGKSALICTVDLINPGYNATTVIRPAISQATGIPVEYIHISGTHTHAAPDVKYPPKVDSMARYMEYYQAQIIKAAKDAIADQKEASLYLGRAVTKNLNFVRHYLMEDGTYSGPNFGNSKQPYIGHESDADPELLLAKITRKGGKDIILCNFGVHQTNSGGQKKYDVSADIAGSMREAMESAIDCHFAYFTAACGNVNPMSKIEEENIVPKGDHVAHGKALAKYALDAADSYTEAQFGAIRAKSVTREFEINHTTDHLVEQAREIHELFTSTNDRAMANQVGREKYGFSSVYHAGAIVSRKNMPATNPVILNTLSVGDLAFALAPYEMFADNGVEIKQGSPFKMTMILTLCNQNSVGYLPTRMSFEHGGYAADTCRFMPGIGEALVEEFIGMIKDMYEQR